MDTPRHTCTYTVNTAIISIIQKKSALYCSFRVFCDTCIQPMAPRARATVLMCGGKPGVLAALAAVAVEGEEGDAEDAVVELDAGGVLRHVPQRRTEAQIHSLEEGVHILNPPPINIFFWK